QVAAAVPALVLVLVRTETLCRTNTRQRRPEGISQVSESVLVTGSAGFIGGYIVEELLSRGYRVVGIDNLSKYGQVTKSYDSDANYTFHEGDCRDLDLMTRLAMDVDHIIAGAALIG